MGTDENPNETKTDTNNYQGLFVIGIAFVGAGTALMVAVGPAMLGLTAMGFIFMTIGLANRNKWQRSS
ncbi:MAG: hypothetical protein ACXABV_03965 [Candidatus Thorarchaeota archaeon]|jgi:hypothetical protein